MISDTEKKLEEFLDPDKSVGCIEQMCIRSNQSCVEFMSQSKIDTVIERKTGFEREVNCICNQSLAGSDGFKFQHPERVYSSFCFRFGNTTFEAENVGNFIECQVGNNNNLFSSQIVPLQFESFFGTSFVNEPLEDNRSIQNYGHRKARSWRSTFTESKSASGRPYFFRKASMRAEALRSELRFLTRDLMNCSNVIFDDEIIFSTSWSKIIIDQSLSQFVSMSPQGASRNLDCQFFEVVFGKN